MDELAMDETMDLFFEERIILLQLQILKSHEREVRSYCDCDRYIYMYACVQIFYTLVHNE